MNDKERYEPFYDLGGNNWTGGHVTPDSGFGVYDMDVWSHRPDVLEQIKQFKESELYHEFFIDKNKKQAD